MTMNQATLTRCSWPSDDLSIRYHDEEWGTPTHDDTTLFEFLILEGAQAGLSGDTILKKRQNYRAAFDNFDLKQIARYDRRKGQSLMNNAGIIRNRLKIASAVQNAKAFLKVQDDSGSFDVYIWQFTGGAPILNSRRSSKQVPARTPESDAMSKDLKKRRFSFVGTTICYAFMQAMGLVNDHLITCFRYSQLVPRKRRRSGD
jgi:DNA-3-methyladenine glycosylase I